MNEFKIAFEQLVRFTLPEKLQDTEKATVYHRIIYFLPLVGLLVGLAMYIAASILFSIVPNAGVAVIICAAALPILQWWLYGGRNFTAVNTTLAHWHAGGVFSGSSDGSGIEKSQWAFTIFNILIGLKMLAVGLLVYFNFTPWLIIVPLLAATTYAEAFAQEEEKGNDEGSGSIPVHWCIAGVVTLIIAGLLNKLIAGLFVLVVAWLAAPYIEKQIRNKSTVNDDTVYRAVMEIVEIAVLWIGLLAIQ
ncbi:MAG: hypothetical protein ACOCZS_00720 [Verrucomicrobiota bacterium]